MPHPLVLVHGLSGSSRWWRAAEPLLGDRDVVAVDIPRYGLRFRPPRTVSWLARRLEPFAPVDLVGHSLGGLVSACLASQHPELVRRLVLVAPVGATTPAGLRALIGLAHTTALAPPVLLRAMVGDALRWGPWALATGAHFSTRRRFAGRIAAPTLLVWGTQDRLVPVELAEAWLGLIPGSRLGLIRSAGHVPMIEAPSAFAELVREFVDDPGDDGGSRPVDGVGDAGHGDEPAADDG